ncbi:ABC transporter family substrate-binding protein [Cellulomonas edaphi]|uniref:ABC transporter family substrate-binding protein n=1 Tax=Cellulomonas edaphi TaxID=3053468 RepID=A0ABT7S772_9CELL|nr:ABC transporter family substrate-binding protein [Cellulomons edaphi]MDM7830794.1 ABC transporter family substrate-binding protein [Cellulomons edaphi]
MKIRRLSAGVAVIAAGALVLTACSNEPSDNASASPSASSSGAASTTGGTVTVSETNEFFSFNPSTANGNTDINSKISLATNSHLYYIDDQLKVQHDDSFAKTEKLSDDPLTVKYTINEGKKWSDGEPIDANDLVLAWAVFSGYYDDAKTDDSGEVVSGASYFSYAGSTLGLGLTDFPEIGDDGRSITLKYSKPFSDWEVALDLDRPAHVVAKNAGLADAAALTDLLKNTPRGNPDKPAKNDALKKVADFYNTGFDSKTLPSDPELYLSSGPYIVSDVQEGQSVTLVPNKTYDGDQTPKLDSIVMRTIADPSAAITALKNGEVDVVSPQANADTLAALEGVPGVQVHQGLQLAFDHIDLNSTGVFKDKNVREAFLKTIPRQAILDAIITPLDPKATVLNSVLFVPAQPGYAKTIETNGFKDFVEPDIAGAKELLGGKTPTVKLLYNINNPNRVDAYTLIAKSAKEAGFKIVDEGDVDWGSRLGDGSYDASIFGWINSGVGVSGVPQIYGTGQSSNFNKMSDKAADAQMSELIQTIDPAAQEDLQVQIEQKIGATFTTLPFFQSVGVDAVADRVKGIDTYNPNQNGVWWNTWEWTVDDAS